MLSMMYWPAFMPDGAVEALDTGVQLRLAGLDVQKGSPHLLSPFHQLLTDVFGDLPRVLHPATSGAHLSFAPIGAG